ncbi:hypothetical protein D3C81_1938150 [compost metagenome]
MGGGLMFKRWIEDWSGMESLLTQRFSDPRVFTSPMMEQFRRPAPIAQGAAHPEPEVAPEA